MRRFEINPTLADWPFDTATYSPFEQLGELTSALEGTTAPVLDSLWDDAERIDAESCRPQTDATFDAMLRLLKEASHRLQVVSFLCRVEAAVQDQAQDRYTKASQAAELLVADCARLAADLVFPQVVHAA